MLIINPEKVTFSGEEWPGVESLAIDRLAHRLVQEWSDHGPWMVFADVSEQRVRVVLVQRLERGSLGGPTPGDSGTLRFEAAAGASDAGRVAVQLDAVVGEVRHEFLRKGGVRSMVLWAISPDGESDPVTVGGAA